MKELINRIKHSKNKHLLNGECFLSEQMLENCPSHKFVDSATFNYYDFPQHNVVYDLVFVNECLDNLQKYTQKSVPSKHFTMLNGNPWLPRPILLTKLLNANIDMHWTANNFIDPNNRSFDVTETEYDYKNIVEEYNTIAGKYWDGERYVSKEKSYSYEHIWDLNADDVHLIKDGLFQIVCDSNCDLPTHINQGQHMITSKLFKCFMSKRPFIYMSNSKYGVYQTLKKEGFKTFESVIDEGFDNETDPNKKLDNIVNLCNNIVKLDINDLYNKTKDICEHNYQHFVNKDWIEFANRNNVEI